MAQHTIQIPITEDTYCDKNNPTTNYGSSTQLKAGGGLAIPTYYINFKCHTMMKWDSSLPGLPERKKIISAYLKLYSLTAISSSDRIVAIYNIDFDEMVSTYNSLSLDGHYMAPEYFYLADTAANNYISLNILNSEEIKIKSGRARFGAVGASDKTFIFGSRESANPPYIELTYEDVPPNAPTPTDPIGDYKDNKSVVRFAWQYNSDVGGVQKAFDLQWSTDQVNWTTVSQTTANNYYDMPADTLPAGNIYWRVRTYNEYDEVGPYCDIQSFYAIGAPAAPVLNAIPTNTARPLVTWSTFDQQIYQLQVLQDDEVIYDSGEQPGINIRQHKIKAWLEDGEYTVRIRIKNEYDLWSEWASTIFSVSTAKPQKPSFSLQRSSHGIEINIQGTDGYALIYRAEYGSDDFICIGNVTGKYFHDCSVKSGTEYRYFVRAVSANETYADSDVKLIQAEIRHSLIAPISDLTDIFEFRRSLNAPPKRNYTRALGGSTVEYEGRKYPVFIPDEHVSAGLALTFFLNSWRAVEKFMGLYDRKETVLYRDSKGRKIYGVLSGLSVEEEREGYTVSFVISQVDHDEEVEV